MNSHEVIALEIESENDNNKIFSYFENFTNQLIIKKYETANGQITVLDISGRKVDFVVMEASDQITTIDLNHVENSVYALLLKSKIKNPKTLKFVR